MPSKIYAVLVGIDQYQKYPLSGCVNDIKAVEKWLGKTYGEEQLQVLRLTDEKSDIQPERPNIIKAFDHFDQAADEDICLFYYCGHGLNVMPPQELNYEPALQAILCKDWDGGNNGKGLLIDKELSYLIWQKTRQKPDLSFVVITDCCHSGTITRSIDEELEEDVRSIAGNFEPPPFSDFIGNTPDDQTNHGYRVEKSFDGTDRLVVKTGRSIHLAAAQDDQKAYEIKTPANEKRGGFTYYLIDSLEKHNGQVTYQEIFDHVGRSLKSYFITKKKNSQQFPCLSIAGVENKETIDDRIFFTKNLKQATRAFELYFDSRESSLGWYLDAGQLDGITVGDIFEIQATDKTNFKLEIRKVYREDAFVAEEIAGLDTGQRYAVRATKPLQSATVVCFDETISAAIQQQVIAQWNQSFDNDLFYNVVFDTTTGAPGAKPLIKADNNAISLDWKDNNFYLCDGSIATIPDKEQLNLLVDNLAKAVNWIRLVGFRNKTISTNAMLPYQLLLKCSNGVDQNGEPIFVDSDPKKSRQIAKYAPSGERPAFQLCISNSFSDTLFVSFAYLDADGSIDTNAFDSIEIEAGNTASMTYDNSNIIPLAYEPQNKDGGEYSTDYLKIFISKTKGISLEAFNQQALVKDYAGTSRSLPPKKSDVSLANFDWQAETICFTIQRKPAS